MTKKTAVVLMNLGGPDSLEAVEPFLFNLFNDPAIIGAPKLIRYFLARMISRKRAPIARDIYAQLGGKSPIVENTQAQSFALAGQLGAGYKVFICMRYWHPKSDAVVRQVKEYGPDEVILLPLYPQYSTSTSRSSIQDWQREAAKQGLQVPTKIIGCYPDDPALVKAQADVILPLYLKAKEAGEPRVLFSAHGLPEKIIKSGDSYQWQVERTTQAVVKALNIENLDYVNCYQSRVGPLKWIGPSTDDEIRRAGKECVPIVLVPIAFVSEHSETLVELDVEYKHLADGAGVPAYLRVPTVSTHPSFIAGLAELCRRAKEGVHAHTGGRICPKEFGQCMCGEA